ncbi:MAG: ChaN family lipoprotein, partial [Candidatus Cloacimonetes bacterium]|nr:ChaN family lipoprotein [Candidatus Cloacimonadota bacterium]
LIHAVEAAVLPYFQQAAPQFAISLEMLERDVQELLDDYLTGRVELEAFLQGARPWTNYLSDYHPLVEFARLQALPVIAANVPRAYASLVARCGAVILDTLSSADKQYIARQLIIFKDGYWNKFEETMTNLGDRHMMFDEQQLDNLYAAQCLKDDTMAEAIADFLEANNGWKVIHYNGHFHSSEHLGTAQKLSLIRPDLRIAVITPVVTDLETWQENLDQYKHLGEYLILLANEETPVGDGN